MTTLRALKKHFEADPEALVLACDEVDLSETECDQHWHSFGRSSQKPPPGDWSIWLIQAGRGFGKTRAGAEWVRAMAQAHPGCRIALVGATIGDARAVMVEGASGLLAVTPDDDKLLWVPSLGRLRWGNGSSARLFSAAEPEGLRGPEHDFAWADEVGKWADAEDCWDNLMLTMRRGDRPRVVATTTPRATALMRRLIADERVVKSFGSTADNWRNLPAAFLEEVTARYAGTRLGRQELDGVLIEDAEGALWSRGMLEGVRVLPSTQSPFGLSLSKPFPSSALVLEKKEGASTGSAQTEWGSGSEFVRVVVGVDPPASSDGDACGIIAVALDADGIGHVLEDASVERPSPERWARAVADCAARWGADRVVAEANNGGAMVESVLLAAESGLPVMRVHASRGKSARAEPVAALYERGRVRHRGVFPALEDQLCGMIAGGGYEGPGRSPDRADALVWALTELMLGQRGVARVRVL